jgi:inner membrane protein
MTLTTAGLMWLIMGGICFVLEMMLPGFIMFFFGLGAWITALVCWLNPVSLNYQLAIFLVSSLASLFILRRFIQKIFIGKETGEIESVSASVGDSAIVVEDIIPPAEGKIDYSGTHWRATADEMIVKGSVVTIISQNGLTMKVGQKK